VDILDIIVNGGITTARAVVPVINAIVRYRTHDSAGMAKSDVVRRLKRSYGPRAAINILSVVVVRLAPGWDQSLLTPTGEGPATKRNREKGGNKALVSYYS